MEWKWVYGYENLYQVSEYGDIFSIKTQIFKKVSFDKNGYPWTMLHGKKKPVKKFIHTLVLEAFIGPKPTEKSVCRHYPDPTVTNNHYTNLIWGTSVENARDRYYNFQWNTTLTEQDVLDIKKSILNGATQAELYKKYNVSPQTINNIVHNKYWKNVGPDISQFKYDKRRILTNTEISQIKYLIKNNYNNKIIKNNYNISTDVFIRLSKNKTHQNVPIETDVSFLKNIKK